MRSVLGCTPGHRPTPGRGLEIQASPGGHHVAAAPTSPPAPSFQAARVLGRGGIASRTRRDAQEVTAQRGRPVPQKTWVHGAPNTGELTIPRGVRGPDAPGSSSRPDPPSMDPWTLLGPAPGLPPVPAPWARGPPPGPPTTHPLQIPPAPLRAPRNRSAPRSVPKLRPHPGSSPRHVLPAPLSVPCVRAEERKLVWLCGGVRGRPGAGLPAARASVFRLRAGVVRPACGT